MMKMSKNESFYNLKNIITLKGSNYTVYYTLFHLFLSSLLYTTVIGLGITIAFLNLDTMIKLFENTGYGFIETFSIVLILIIVMHCYYQGAKIILHKFTIPHYFLLLYLIYSNDKIKNTILVEHDFQEFTIDGFYYKNGNHKHIKISGPLTRYCRGHVNQKKFDIFFYAGRENITIFYV